MPILTALCLLSPVVAETLTDAKSAHARGELAVARSALDTVLASSNSGTPAARVANQNLAVIKAQQGDVDGAIATLELVIASDPVSAAAFANLKALRAFQAAESISAALGTSSDSVLPALSWLDQPEGTTLPVRSDGPDQREAVEPFVADYARALGERNTADYLGLYALSYAPADGAPRAVWQLDVLRDFASANTFEPTYRVEQAHALNAHLVTATFSVGDAADGNTSQRAVLLQRDGIGQWKILSELTP
ncbi:MAG: hypothetical protein AAF460_10645 [Pseudomonadota bacterium]